MLAALILSENPHRASEFESQLRDDVIGQFESQVFIFLFQHSVGKVKKKKKKPSLSLETLCTSFPNTIDALLIMKYLEMV